MLEIILTTLSTGLSHGRPTVLTGIAMLCALLAISILFAAKRSEAVKVGSWRVSRHTAETARCILTFTAELQMVLSQYHKRHQQLAPDSELMWESAERFFEEFSVKFVRGIDKLVEIPPEAAGRKTSGSDPQETRAALLFVESAHSLVVDCNRAIAALPACSSPRCARIEQFVGEFTEQLAGLTQYFGCA